MWGREGQPSCLLPHGSTQPSLLALPTLSPSTSLPPGSGFYLSDFANEAPIGEEDDHDWDDEVDDKHVDDVGLVVVVRVVGVIVGATGALHPLRHVPASKKCSDHHQDPPWGQQKVSTLGPPAPGMRLLPEWRMWELLTGFFSAPCSLSHAPALAGFAAQIPWLEPR